MDGQSERKPENRPPSEQTIEHQLLDAVGGLQERLDELAKRPPVMIATSNWWDQLDPGLADVVVEGMLQYMLPCRQPNALVLRVNCLRDRFELSLQMNGGWIVWQRALFYGRPAA